MMLPRFLVVSGVAAGLALGDEHPGGLIPQWTRDGLEKARVNALDAVNALEAAVQKEANMRAQAAAQAERKKAVAPRPAPVAVENDEATDKKREAVMILYQTTYGTDVYWMKSTRERQLTDAATAAFLKKAGLNPVEIRYWMEKAKYR